MMQANPYTPPKSDLCEKPMPLGAPLKAILLGFAIEVVASGLLFVIVLTIVVAFVFFNAGLEPSQISVEPYSSLISTGGIIIGMISSVLGGFVCARISRREDFKLGYILGAISSLSPILLWNSSDLLVTDALLALLTFAMVLIGTKLGMKR